MQRWWMEWTFSNFSVERQKFFEFSAILMWVSECEWETFFNCLIFEFWNWNLWMNNSHLVFYKILFNLWMWLWVCVCDEYWRKQIVIWIRIFFGNFRNKKKTTRQLLMSYGQNEKSLLKLIIHLFFGFRFFGYKKLFFTIFLHLRFILVCSIVMHVCVCPICDFEEKKMFFRCFHFFFVRIDRTTSLYCFFFLPFFRFFSPFLSLFFVIVLLLLLLFSKPGHNDHFIHQ